METLEVYNTFQRGTAGDDVKVDKIMEKFERYCNPRKNLTFDRHSFFTRNQQEGETIDTYATELRNKASRCEFADLKDGLIRDRIVCGIINDSVRECLLRESDLSLEKCVDICRASEISAFQLKELSDEKSVHAVRVEDKAGQSDTWKEKRKGIKLVTIFVTIVAIDIGEVVAQHMARTAIDAKSCIILPVCVKQKR
jgi:hypothetical protein